MYFVCRGILRIAVTRVQVSKTKLIEIFRTWIRCQTVRLSSSHTVRHVLWCTPKKTWKEKNMAPKPIWAHHRGRFPIIHYSNSNGSLFGSIWTFFGWEMLRFPTDPYAICDGLSMEIHINRRIYLLMKPYYVHGSRSAGWKF